MFFIGVKQLDIFAVVLAIPSSLQHAKYPLALHEKKKR